MERRGRCICIIISPDYNYNTIVEFSRQTTMTTILTRFFDSNYHERMALKKAFFSIAWSHNNARAGMCCSVPYCKKTLLCVSRPHNFYHKTSIHTHIYIVPLALLWPNFTIRIQLPWCNHLENTIGLALNSPAIKSTHNFAPLDLRQKRRILSKHAVESIMLVHRKYTIHLCHLTPFK